MCISAFVYLWHKKIIWPSIQELATSLPASRTAKSTSERDDHLVFLRIIITFTKSSPCFNSSIFKILLNNQGLHPPGVSRSQVKSEQANKLPPTWLSWSLIMINLINFVTHLTHLTPTLVRESQFIKLYWIPTQSTEWLHSSLWRGGKKQMVFPSEGDHTFKSYLCHVSLYNVRNTSPEVKAPVGPVPPKTNRPECLKVS